MPEELAQVVAQFGVRPGRVRSPTVRNPSGVPVSRRLSSATTAWNGDRAACACSASVSCSSPPPPGCSASISSHASAVSTYRPVMMKLLGASSTDGFSTRSLDRDHPVGGELAGGVDDAVRLDLLAGHVHHGDHAATGRGAHPVHLGEQRGLDSSARRGAARRTARRRRPRERNRRRGRAPSARPGRRSSTRQSRPIERRRSAISDLPLRLERSRSARRSGAKYASIAGLSRLLTTTM